MGDGPGNQKKIVLPSSGLAEDILKAHAEVAAPAPAPAQAVAQSLDEDIADIYEQEKKEEEEESLHLVGFFLNNEEYALEISQVQEIIRAGECTRVPNAPRHIRGVINLRGRIIPVIDLKVRMDLKETGLTKNTRIMVIETGGRVLGVLVDGVSQVLRLPLKLVEDAPEEVSEADKGFIKGVGKLDGRLVILLDLARTIGREDKAA